MYGLLGGLKWKGGMILLSMHVLSHLAGALVNRYQGTFSGHHNHVASGTWCVVFWRCHGSSKALNMLQQGHHQLRESMQSLDLAKSKLTCGISTGGVMNGRESVLKDFHHCVSPGWAVVTNETKMGMIWSTYIDLQ